MHIDFNKENNNETPKFKIGNNIRLSKHRNIFAKDYVPNWSEEVFVTKKLGTFCKEELEKTNQKQFRVGK